MSRSLDIVTCQRLEIKWLPQPIVTDLAKLTATVAAIVPVLGTAQLSRRDAQLGFRASEPTPVFISGGASLSDNGREAVSRESRIERNWFYSSGPPDTPVSPASSRSSARD